MAIKKIGTATEVISLADAREHLRLVPFGDPLGHPDDDYINLAITGARDYVEEHTGRAIATQQYEIALDEFPNAIQLPADVQTVDSLTYVDGNGATQTIISSNYSLDNHSEPSWLLPAYGYTWPDTLDSANAVKVTFTSGYTDNTVPDDNPCPKAIIFAMYLIIGSFYENRQQEQASTGRLTYNNLEFGVDRLLQPYRLNLGV